jgi:hypothetical protein
MDLLKPDLYQVINPGTYPNLYICSIIIYPQVKAIFSGKEHEI